ncbi:TRIC cation channel family protein, partial [Micrococcus yunnanensis]
PWLLTALDLVGVFFFAVSGALLAARKDFDLVGSVALALLAGLGGGITRDIVLDRGLPASLQDPIYLAPPVLVSLLVYVKAIHPNRLNLTITLFDAAGLALFTVSGVMIAHAMGVHPVSVVVVATVGALGGGVLRDIVANEGPVPYTHRV